MRKFETHQAIFLSLFATEFTEVFKRFSQCSLRTVWLILLLIQEVYLTKRGDPPFMIKIFDKY
jgi:uncharacterized membrane protein